VSIDDDSVVDTQPGLARHVEVGHRSQTGHRGIGGDLAAVVEDSCHAHLQTVLAGAAASHLADPVAGDETDSGVGELLVVLLGDVGGEHRVSQHLTRQHEGDPPAVPDQGRGELRTDVPATDHQEAVTVQRQTHQPAVVLGAAVVDHRSGLSIGQRPRDEPGGQQQALVADRLARGGDDLLVRPENPCHSGLEL